jgi:methionyl-tRNA formyltransferase
MDAGAILAQSRLEVGETETAGEAHDRLAADGADLVQRTLQDLAAGRAIEREQDEALASKAPRLSRKDAAIDWTASSAAVARQICAMWPWPGCHVRLLDAAGGEIARLALARARAASCDEGPRWTAGEIQTAGAVRCGESSSCVQILEVQPEGKRLMSMADFRRGHAWMPGMRLESH